MAEFEKSGQGYDSEFFKKMMSVLGGVADEQGKASGQSMLMNTEALNKLLLKSMTQGTAQLTKQGASLEKKYAPQYAELYDSLVNEYDPYFNQVRDKLGSMALGDLNSGYDLGADLDREVTQDIRAGQDARGNWYGPAPTADEAFQKGSARVGLYNQRLANAGNFLQLRSPSDMWSSVRGATQATRTYQPTVAPSTYPQYSPMGIMAGSLYPLNPVNPLAAGGSSNWMGGALGGGLSGAMSGAAAGTMVMPGWGTAIGAVGGGLMGALGGGMGTA